MKKGRHNYLIGIDEVGRGPIAGPVAVGVFACLTGKVPRVFKKVKESKQLTKEGREAWHVVIKTEAEKGTIKYAVSFESASVIDAKGIVYAITSALTKSLKKIGCDPRHSRVLLDGGLKAPPKYKNQKTIIRGDAREAVIALASIVAKVARDNRITLVGKRYRAYGFHKHKGYGTQEHYKALKKHGLTPLHRRSFLKSFNPSV